MRDRAIRATPAAGGRELHIENVIASQVGMHASPAGPMRKEMKMTARIERPWREDGVTGEEKHDSECKDEAFMRLGAYVGKKSRAASQLPSPSPSPQVRLAAVMFLASVPLFLAPVPVAIALIMPYVPRVAIHVRAVA